MDCFVALLLAMTIETLLFFIKYVFASKLPILELA